jgi:hypothetical protein
VDKLIVIHEYRGPMLNILLFWSQNLVYFGSLAHVLAMPHHDPDGIERVGQVVEHRIEQFRIFQEKELDGLPETLPGWENVVSEVFETMQAAAPLTPEAIFVSKWLLTHQIAGAGLKATLGEPCWQLTSNVAALFKDRFLCTGITDKSFIEHFDYWKSVAWHNKDGLQAVRQHGDPHVRSIRCSGFSDVPDKPLCSKCSVVRRHLQKEKSAYKTEPPGLKFLQNAIPPGHREILDRWKANFSGFTTPASLSPSTHTPSLPRSIASSSASIPADFDFEVVHVLLPSSN